MSEPVKPQGFADRDPQFVDAMNRIADILYSISDPEIAMIILLNLLVAGFRNAGTSRIEAQKLLIQIWSGHKYQERIGDPL